MNLNWLFVYSAGILEIFWVSGLKHASTIFEFIVTAALIVASFSLITVAIGSLPIGTVYAVFTGIGTAGTVLAEMIVFGEAFNFIKIFLVATLLSGVVALKFLSGSKDSSKVNSKGEVV